MHTKIYTLSLRTVYELWGETAKSAVVVKDLKACVLETDSSRKQIKNSYAW